MLDHDPLYYYTACSMTTIKVETSLAFELPAGLKTGAIVQMAFWKANFHTILLCDILLYYIRLLTKKGWLMTCRLTYFLSWPMKWFYMNPFGDLRCHTGNALTLILCHAWFYRYNKERLPVIFCLVWRIPRSDYCLLLGVSLDYAQPITDQVTEVTCPGIGRTQPAFTPSKRQKKGPDHLRSHQCTTTHQYTSCDLLVVYVTTQTIPRQTCSKEAGKDRICHIHSDSNIYDVNLWLF